jgi:hypothetical protein
LPWSPSIPGIRKILCTAAVAAVLLAGGSRGGDEGPDLLRSATHFEPCLFRPPRGAVDSSVLAAAAEAGLRTILWDVDPSDWFATVSELLGHRTIHRPYG